LPTFSHLARYPLFLLTDNKTYFRAGSATKAEKRLGKNKHYEGVTQQKMVNIDKNATTYDRDEQGNLLSKKVELKTYPKEKYGKIGVKDGETPEVEVLPCPRGKLNRLQKKSEKQEEEGDEVTDADQKLIADHLKNPEYSKDEVGDINDLDLVEAYIAAIQSVSLGVKQEDIKDKSASERLEEMREQAGESFQQQ